MRQEETFDLTLARACARAVSGACGVGVYGVRRRRTGAV